MTDNLDIFNDTLPCEINATKLFDETKIVTANIQNDDQFEALALFRKKTKDMKDEILDQQKQNAQPIKDHYEKVNAPYKRAIDTIKQVDDILKKAGNDYAMLKYQRQQAAIAEERKRKEDEALREAERLEKQKENAQGFDDVTAKAMTDVLTAKQNQVIEQSANINVESLSTKNSTTRLVWDFEIVDKSQISPDYLIVNETAIRQAIRAGVRDIRGVKIFQKPQIAIK